MPHPHWAICDVSNPPASGFNEAVELKSANKTSPLTETQKWILEYIGEEYTPVEKSLDQSADVSNTPSSSTETGDDKEDLSGNNLNMSDSNPEFLALKQELEEAKKALQAQKDLVVMSKSLQKFSFEAELESKLAEVLAQSGSEVQEVVVKALESISVKVEEAEKSVKSAEALTQEASSKLVADLAVEKGHADTVSIEPELTYIEQSLKIIEQRQSQAQKGSK